MAKKIIGTCCICGKEKKLTYEHLPLRGTGNKIPMVERAALLNNQKDVIRQQGSGLHSLCESCNNNTGSWYGNEYEKFHSYIINSGNTEIQKSIYTGEIKIYTNEIKIKPLKVFKEIVCMFLSINPPPIFLKERENFKNFILNREEKDLKNIKVYMYIQDSKSKINRRNAFNKLIDLLYGRTVFVSEFVSNGIGYILTLDNKNTWHVDEFAYKCKGLYDITFFKNYTIDEEVKIKIKTNILETNSPFSLDFREQTTIKKIKSNDMYSNLPLNIKVSDNVPIFIAYGMDSRYDSKITFPKKIKVKKENQ